MFCPKPTVLLALIEGISLQGTTQVIYITCPTRGARGTSASLKKLNNHSEVDQTTILGHVRCILRKSVIYISLGPKYMIAHVLVPPRCPESHYFTRTTVYFCILHSLSSLIKEIPAPHFPYETAILELIFGRPFHHYIVCPLAEHIDRPGLLVSPFDIIP